MEAGHQTHMTAHVVIMLLDDEVCEGVDRVIIVPSFLALYKCHTSEPLREKDRVNMEEKLRWLIVSLLQILRNYREGM